MDPHDNIFNLNILTRLTTIDIFVMKITAHNYVRHFKHILYFWTKQSLVIFHQDDTDNPKHTFPPSSAEIFIDS